MNKFSIALVALAAGTITGPLAAKSHVRPDGTPYGLVHTSGLDLASPAVVRKLQDRVRRKAESICPDDYEIDEMEPSPERRHCLDIAVSSGFAQIEARHSAALAKQNSANAPHG